jgi:hypothetical protein
MLAIAHPLPEGWLGGRLERGGRGGRRFPSTQVGSQPRRHVVRAAGRFKSSVLVWRACGGERWAGGAGAVLQSYPILDQVRAALQSLCLIGLTDSLARQSKLQQRGKATGGGGHTIWGSTALLSWPRFGSLTLTHCSALGIFGLPDARPSAGAGRHTAHSAPACRPPSCSPRSPRRAGALSSCPRPRAKARILKGHPQNLGEVAWASARAEHVGSAAECTRPQTPR